jgi:Leucine-rich repeat (LRR) protein
MFCFGPFCGKFHDELQGSDDEDDDCMENGEKPIRGPGKNKSRESWFKSVKKKTVKKKHEDFSSSSSGYMRWSPFLSRITVKVKMKRGEMSQQQVVRLKVVNRQDLNASMMNSICQLTSVHTLEIIRCEQNDIPPSLQDMDALAVVRMSHNHIKKFSEDFAKVQRIERIILDFNQISEFPPGIFSQRTFKELEVVNLAHNKLTMLPPDFGITAPYSGHASSGSQIKYIDLSYNAIVSLPDNVPRYCKQLEVLNLSHNNLKTLPADFELKKLQRLFVSFNELRELPKNIGKCKELSKIRIISNQIRELPPSILDLWKPGVPGGPVQGLCNGKLEEFLPDKNPLIMPSITTFEMAASNEQGIFEAFSLFRAYLKDEKLREEQNKKAPVVIGITGCSRCGKGWVSQELLRAVEMKGKKAAIIAQDDYWYQMCKVEVNGQVRKSEEEPGCTNHEKFAAAIKEHMDSCDVVIAEGRQLLHHSRVESLLSSIFLLELGRDEAKSRRTQPQDPVYNPNPLSGIDFDELSWPAYERYITETVDELGARVVNLQGPSNPAQRDALTKVIMHYSGLVASAASSLDKWLAVVSGASTQVPAITDGHAAGGAAIEAGEGTEQEDALHPYYFSHCYHDGHVPVNQYIAQQRIAEVRNAESTLLLVKRQMFVERLKGLAKAYFEKENQNASLVPERLQEFLDPHFTAPMFKGKVQVTNLDLYMNLLVMSTKHMFSTCHLLFDKFEIGDKGFMSKDEWGEFCMCLPIQIDEPVQEQMWQMMTWREPEKLLLNDFVAAWHIHDIENRDPWIARVAEVLRMDYYDMDALELRRRLRAKASSDATPDLDFDTKLEEQAGGITLDSSGKNADRGGVLTVEVQGALNLRNRDSGVLGDVSDPYASVRFGGLSYRTKTIVNMLNPVWDDENVFTFPVNIDAPTPLEIELFDEDPKGELSLGMACVFVRDLPNGVWVDKKERFNKREASEVQFKVRLEMTSSTVEGFDVLNDAEGLRALPRLHAADASRRKAPVQATKDHDSATLLHQISLSGQQQVQYEEMLRQEHDEDDDDYASLSSENLSEDTGSSASEFDAQVFLRSHRNLMTRRQMDAYGKPLVVNNDADMKKLMQVPPDEFYKRSKYGVANAEASGAIAAMNPVSKPRHRGAQAKRSGVCADPKMKTDVFAVRQALRRVYRSMPSADFVKLINFLLRGMQLIKHSPSDSLTYWHVDDPTFKHTMGVLGSNKYTRILLLQMGFAMLSEAYWVWPCVHLDKAMRGISTWGDQEVAANCPGKDRHRLDDMIMLLRSCQRALHLKDKKFTGHFKSLDV